MSLPVFPTVRGLAFPVVKSPGFNPILQTAPNMLETAIAQTYNPVWEWQLIYEFLFDNAAILTAGTYTDYATLQGFILARGSEGKGEFLFTDPQDNSVGPAVLAGVPNPQAQLQLVNDGVGNYYSPVQRNFGGQFYEDVTDLNGSIAVYANGVLKSNGGVGFDYSIVGPGLALLGKSYMGLVVAWTSPSAWSGPNARGAGYKILDPAGHIQLVTTAGTTGSTIPTFNDVGGTTTDGSVVWTDQGYNPGPTGPISAQFSFYFRVRFPEDKHDFTEFMNQLWTLGGSESQTGGALILRSSRPVQL